MKQLDEGDSDIVGRMVRVDKVLLPTWAKNRHHYILANYLSIEHPKVRAKIGHWIDLIFGENQQNPDVYNLFKPLTSEVYHY